MSIRIIFLTLLAVPHYVFYLLIDAETKSKIDEDIMVMNKRTKNNKNLLYWLATRKPYRNLFYYRIPKARFLKFILPEYPLFTIVSGCDFAGGAFVLNHPYATILNARKIGKKFTCCHLTTIGNKVHGDNSSLPSIGDNVSLGANVSIIGGVTIGNNVTIGAGSVVVKDIPDNCIAVGNPAKIIKVKRNE